MKMLKRNIVKIVLISLCLFVLTINPAMAAVKFVSIATGSTGGTFYPVGVIFATTFGDELKDSGYRFSAHASGGSSENLEMIRNKEIKMAIAGSVPVATAYQGVGKYEGKAIENVRFVTSLWPEAIQLVYRIDSGIEKLADFKNKKIAVGPAAGGGSIYLPTIFKEVAGMTFNDFKPQYIGYNDSVQAIQNRLVDACYLGAGLPTAGVSQLYAGQVPVGMIEFTDKEIEKVKKVAPYFTRVVIERETYPKQDKDLQVIGVKSSLIAEKDLDDDIVYKMLEVIYKTRLDDFKKQHGALKILSLDEAVLGLSGAPLHPGAVKFYRDNNVDVPDSLIPPEMK